MLDKDFLTGLGIKEELLPSASRQQEVVPAVKEQILPITGEKWVPVELLELSHEDL